MSEEYVLREADDAEINRLKFQHGVWKAQTDQAIAAAQIRQGDRILDLGCGPGYLSYDLAEKVGAEGEIFALDNSAKFIDFIKKQAIENITPIQADLREGLINKLELDSLNKIFCRWVLMFSGKLENTISDIYDLLEEGGQFISIEYFRFHQIDLFPKSEIFNKIYTQVQAILRANGGNPNIGEEVYKVMEKKGFKNIQLIPVYRTGAPGTPLWEWLERTNVNHENLVKANLINQEELEAYHQDWKAKSNMATAFLTAPPLMITIGEK